jgi:hypothetical protein
MGEGAAMKTTALFKTPIMFGALLAIGAGAAAPAQAQSINLPDNPNFYQTYGNLNSYSLPSLAGIYDELHGGGTGPGNPYYIASTPGAIKDLVVIYTGSSGTGVTTNAAGFEDAYETPNGKTASFASMTGAVHVDVPAYKAGISNLTSDSWDASLLALKGFLDGGDPVFLFNNNDTNEDQSLAIWAKLWLTNPDGSLYGRYLYLSNENTIYGQGGVSQLSGDAKTYNPTLTLGVPVEPKIGTDSSTGLTDYVLSGGTICFDALWKEQACNGSQAHKINHNLGANQAAYAGVVPLLNDWLDTLFASDDTTLDQYTLHLDLRLGCATGWNDCANIKIDNGFEQLFLASTTRGVPAPEPATLALVGLSLLSLWLMARRRRYCPV